MKVLAVEDDPVALAVLLRALQKLGHDVVRATNGDLALELLERDEVRVVVSDWIMPGVNGLELCRRLRARLEHDYVYFILLSSNLPSEDNVREAIEAGVDDYLQKPLDPLLIAMRLHVAERILRFAIQVRQLEEFLPICGYCKKVRDDRNYWQQIESYINARTGTDFSHSVCPDCYTDVIMPQLEELRAEAEGKPGPAGLSSPSAEKGKPYVRRTH
jgi:DNA-binding response OmpR family regulator